MSNDNEKKKVYNQVAWILNYQPQIKEQHIHMGGQTVDDKPVDDEAEYEEVKEEDTLQPAPADTGKLPDEAVNDGCRFFSDEKAIDKCFKFNSDFVKRSVSTLVADFYQGNYANLALIEITLFHHQQLNYIQNLDQLIYINLYNNVQVHLI